jgi:hypothetical protein
VLFGLAVLYGSLWTKRAFDWRRVSLLPRSEQSKAVPLWVGLVLATGAACTALGIHALFFPRAGLLPTGYLLSLLTLIVASNVIGRFLVGRKR